jgi:RNA recognition motif-containing protein
LWCYSSDFAGAAAAAAAAGNSKGFGFVSFDCFEASDAAIEGMNGQYLSNRQITVSYAYKKDTKGELSKGWGSQTRAVAVPCEMHSSSASVWGVDSSNRQITVYAYKDTKGELGDMPPSVGNEIAEAGQQGEGVSCRQKHVHLCWLCHLYRVTIPNMCTQLTAGCQQTC